MAFGIALTIAAIIGIIYGIINKKQAFRNDFHNYINSDYCCMDIFL